MADDDGALETQLDELSDQLADLRTKVGEQAGDARERLDPFMDEVKSNWESLRKAVDQMGSATSDAVKEMSGQAEAAVKGLRDDLGTVQADLRAEMADSRDSYAEAVRELTASWRTRIDQLRVQADLGRMEARDEINEDISRAESLWSDLKQRAEELADQAGEATADARDEVRRLVSDLQETLRDAVDRLRRED